MSSLGKLTPYMLRFAPCRRLELCSVANNLIASVGERWVIALQLADSELSVPD